MHSRDSVDVIGKQAAVRRRAAETHTEHETAPQQHPLLKLQRQMGNAFVARMLAQREAPEEEELQAKHDPALAQREAPEEEELQAKHDPSLAQREAAEEEEIQTKRDPALAQRAATPEVGLEGGPISADLSSRIQSKRGSGSTLDSTTRTSMESSFGTRFDDVRVHHDSESDTLNRSISAKAFTTGSDIFFSQNANPSDSQLLAHELTHVVQQRGMSHSGPMTVGPAGDSHEQAADGMASAVTSGAAASAQRKLEEHVVAPVAREAAPEEEPEMM
jgi:hypothetical protein